MGKISKVANCYYEDTSVFKTDFRYVVEAVKAAGDKIKMAALVRKETYFDDMEPETYDLIAAYIKKPELIGMKKKCTNIGGKVSMCKAIDDMIMDGKQEGIQEGIQEGRLEGEKIGFIEALVGLHISKENIIEKMLEKFSVDEETANIYYERALMMMEA